MFRNALPLALDHTRLTIGAQALGIAQGAIDASIAYMKQRNQFGRPIVSTDDNSPWKFVVLRYQTPPREYLTGFSINQVALFIAVLVRCPNLSGCNCPTLASCVIL